MQKNPWNLKPHEHGKLATLQRTNRSLYRAYLLKESLCDILDRGDELTAPRRLGGWMSWAQRCRLAPFVKLKRTIKKHREGILAYIRTRFSNGPVEARNGKARTITRRSFGFHGAYGLIALLKLCCGNIRLSPVFNYPT